MIEALDGLGCRTTLVHTGQHYDDVMSKVFFDDLELRQPDFHLGVGSGSHAQQTGKVLIEFEILVRTLNPDVVVVVGDVNSSLAGALVGAKAGAVVAHVEAGLRSRDWTMPEEINRVVVDRLSDLLFAPSSDAADNLRQEGYREDQIHLVGNVMIDTLLANRARADQREVWKRFGVERGGYGIVTLHRPANVDESLTLRGLVESIESVCEQIPLIFPVHPRTRPMLSAVMNNDSRVKVCDPLGYLDFLSLMSGAKVVLTDSGGIQEETTVLGIPCLTLRDNTERPITVAEGTNQIVGRSRPAIHAGLSRVLAGEISPRRPALWDGRAGERIASVIANMNISEMVRPTEVSTDA